jgi:FkbM family methyltransferase
MKNEEFFTITGVELNQSPPKALIYFKLNASQYENKNLSIRICDGIFDFVYHYTSMSFNKDCVYFIGSSITHALSNSIKLQIFDGKDLIFSESFISSNLKISNLLKDAPQILKYMNDGIDVMSFVEIFCNKEYDCDLFSLEKNDIVLDIGSNVGAFIVKAINDKCSKIYSCEPFIKSFSILEDYFGHFPQVILNHAAISEKTEEKSLVLLSDSETSGGNFIADNESIDWHDRNKPQQKIQGYSFLDFIKKNNIEFIDYFKCDCEGGEHYIFTEENSEYIRNNVKKIAVEYHGHFDNLISFFLRNNFEYKLFVKDPKIGLIFAKNTLFK